MIRTVVTVEIDDIAAGPQGTKEAVAMALEPLGAVRILEVETRGPEQIHMAPNWGAGKER